MSSSAEGLTAFGGRWRSVGLVLALVLGLLMGLLAAVADPVAPPAVAATVHCVGYESCGSQGYSTAGYPAASQRSHWGMVTGHNCTNYVAFRVIQRGGPVSRPWEGSGDAHRWGHELPGSTDATPIVGSVAWWDSFTGGWGENGHVAYVERVVSPSTIQISEDIYNGDFRWRTISRGDPEWPSGFIHLVDERVRSRGAGPQVDGIPRVGETVSVSPGRWEPGSVDLTYRWLADGRAVSKATKPALVLTPQLVGAAMSVEVTARHLGYLPATVTTSRTNPVRRGTTVVAGTPRISGRALVGEVLAVSRLRTRPNARATYQWLADGNPVRGATERRFRLDASRAGSRIAVRITLRASGYEPRRVTTRRVGPVARASLRKVSVPRILGEPRVGETLMVVPAEWSVTPSRRAYVWFADDEVIEGEHGARLTLGPELVGRHLAVVEGARRRGYEPGIAVSQLVGPVR